MSNTVSTEATLFSTTHPDVVKRTSVSSIIISAILCVIGAGAFATSLKMGDSSSTMSMVLMAGGTILFLWAVFRFFWRGKEWVYAPTGSVAKEGTCFFDVCDLQALTDAFIGVDVIVGTRGETEEYFEDAYRFIEGLDVTQLHVFSYSERPGTQALKIEYVVSPEEKHRRSQRLLALSDAKTKAFYTSHIGREAWVLMEKSKAGTPMHGFTDNYIRVEMDHDDQLDNQLIRVRMGGFNEEGTALKGVLV